MLAVTQKKIAAAKKDLFLTVQSKIFPKYGFEASPKGVQASLGAFAPYNNTDAVVIERNLIMGYWTSPELQTVSLDEFLENAKRQAVAKAPAPKAPTKAAPQQTSVKPQAKPAAKTALTPTKGSAKLAMLQKMKAQGDQGASFQRLDAQGQAAGLAPAEFVTEVNDIYEQGQQYTEAGRYVEGEPLLREAYQLFEEVCGEGHLYTIGCANTLGFNLHEQGRFAEGEAILKIAVDGFTRYCGRLDERTVSAMNNYALCLQGTGKNGEAAAILREILKHSEENHAVTAMTSIMSNLAETLRLDGQVREAEEMFFKAFRILSMQLGPDCLQCITLLNNLAVCFRDLRKNDMARQHYERALKGFKQYYGPDHPKVKLIEKNLEELKTDRDTEHVALPEFLKIEPRKAEARFYKADDTFRYRPMTTFSDKGIRDFDKVIQPIQACMPRSYPMGAVDG